MPDPILPDRKKLNPKDPNPCQGCSNCCEYMALEIDRPTTLKDFDKILWYVLHRDVWVYITHERDWYIQFNTPCEKLTEGRCDYYAYRPHMCRDYEPKDCLRYSEGELEEEYLFKNERELFDYLHKKRPVMYRKLKASVGIPRIPQIVSLQRGSKKRSYERP